MRENTLGACVFVASDAEKFYLALMVLAEDVLLIIHLFLLRIVSLQDVHDGVRDWQLLHIEVMDLIVEGTLDASLTTDHIET